MSRPAHGRPPSLRLWLLQTRCLSSEALAVTKSACYVTVSIFSVFGSLKEAAHVDVKDFLDEKPRLGEKEEWAQAETRQGRPCSRRSSQFLGVELEERCVWECCSSAGAAPSDSPRQASKQLFLRLEASV